MKKKLNNSIQFVYVILIFFIVGCNYCKQKPNDNLFAVEPTIDFECISASGYKVAPEDVLILKKEINDTICYFQFNEHQGQPIYKYWIVKLSNLDRNNVERFLNYHNVEIISLPDTAIYFTVRSQINDLTFRCSIDSLDTTLIVMYKYNQEGK